MSERLTEIGLFIDEPVYIIKKWKKSAAIDKLAQLEDILEQYGIENVEELSNALEFAKVIENILSEYGIKDNEELDKKLADGITWQKACELACEKIDCEYMYGINKENYSQYFYQQAKTEGNDERKN